MKNFFYIVLFLDLFYLIGVAGSVEVGSITIAKSLPLVLVGTIVGAFSVMATLRLEDN